MKVKRQDPLENLLELASVEILRKLIKALVSRQPDPLAPWQEHVSRRQIRRECLEFLKAHVPVDASGKEAAETAALFALWEDLEPDLRELDTYGGGPEETETRVMDLLYEITKKLKTSTIPQPARRQLLDHVLVYLKRGNAGMDDPLAEVADVTCYTPNDQRHLAQRLEDLGKERTVEDVIDIYRQIGDRDKYLSLRSARLRYGRDYHELASFYWNSGERDKALKVAHEGLKKTVEGRTDKLRAFAAKHATDAQVSVRGKRVPHAN